jgi:hypothetical protein
MRNIKDRSDEYRGEQDGRQEKRGKKRMERREEGKQLNVEGGAFTLNTNSGRLSQICTICLV